MEEYKVVAEIYEAFESLCWCENRFAVLNTACATKIEDLGLSVRSYNCLKRSGVDNVKQVIGFVREDKLWNIRNLGKNSRAEIRVKLVEFGYICLREKDRKEFIKSLLELNKDKYIVVS